MAWIILIVAGLLEVVWALALKQSAGWTKLWPSVIGIVSAIASLVLLASALKTLPVGTAYSIWVGIGTFGVTVAGIVALGESAAPLRLVFVGFIVIGVIGLKVLPH